MKTDPVITFKNVTKRFKKLPPALDKISFSLPSEKMIGVIGPDGSGKTTLLRLMVGLLLPEEGTVEVLGSSTQTDVEQIRNQVRYMPQRFALYEELSVMENLNLYAALQGFEEKNGARFEELLEFAKLASFTQRRAGDLSGGMKQKLALICSLITKPKVLILDEPTVGVDPIARRQLWEMVVKLCQEGVSVVWSTTYISEAEQCDHILFLNETKLLFEGAPDKLYQNFDKAVSLIPEEGKKRELLIKVEKEKGVIDAKIASRGIRVVFDPDTFSQGEKVEPSLEDAIVDLMGGIQKDWQCFSDKAPVSKEKKEFLIEANGLKKMFGSFTAVDKMSFSVKKGEIFGLLGPNGAGKSTTFKMLCDLLKPTSGHALVSGYDLQKEGKAAREKIGYMAQKFSLYKDLSIRQNLTFFSGVYPHADSVEERLSLFNLTKEADEICSDQSFGILQKLSLAAATVHWPDILFLDEPTSGMDPIARRHFWSEMNRLALKGKTILVSTHFMPEAENCDRLALINEGKLIYLGSVDSLKEKTGKEDLEEAFIDLVEGKGEK